MRNSSPQLPISILPRARKVLPRARKELLASLKLGAEFLFKSSRVRLVALLTPELLER
jgi:hypothetical protein